MTDRELLTMAARAVNGGAWHPLTHLNPWNPLTDDGDALRLAVKLRLRISISSDHEYTEVCYFPEFGHKRLSGGVVEPWGEDGEAATKRAIVRAAAEIGKAMP